MDSLFPVLSRRFEASKPVGYLNFSDGKPDVRFRATISEIYGFLLEQSDPAPWQTLAAWLLASAKTLNEAGSAAFRDVTQATEVIPLALQTVLQTYRQHHSDLLAHQTDFTLFTPFFLTRCCEVTLSERAKGTKPEKIARNVVRILNDFVGYRPIAILETRPQTDYYAHEKVAAVPLYFRGVGAGPGPYAEMIRTALELLNKTDPDLLDEACLSMERLDEIAVDPRATDHFHPVNKRPNVLFGEWDPHHIDGSGYYRRFVVRQGTLDALVRWSMGTTQTRRSLSNKAKHGEFASPLRPGLLDVVDPAKLLESSAVLAGTILMGAGICGTGPTYHDSSVTLATLVQKIARFRDRFYQKLLETLPGDHGTNLRSEAARLKQPFGGVRQSLNQAIASERALHLQERRLAILFAAMGYPTTARTRSASIPAPATRLLTEIRLRQTAAHFALRKGTLENVPELLGEVEDLLRRGIDCGALIDPWNILGYQGLFPTFSDRADAVRDPRAEELILTLGRQFDAYAGALTLVAATGDEALSKKLRSSMLKLAEWWDKFATSTVTEMPKVIGSERSEAANHVARALALWKTGGASDPAFWRKYREGFRTPSAFSQVIEALLDQTDYKASMALLVTWLNESNEVPLQDPSASFFRLAFRWLKTVTNSTVISVNERASLVWRFFELLEVNADDRWHIPDLGLGGSRSDGPEDDDDDLTDSELDEEDLDDEDDEDDTYSSAYEDMTYKDSTDDGNEGSLVDDGEPKGDGGFPLDADAESTRDRLRFLMAVARMWRLAARPDVFPTSDSNAAAVLAGWVRQTRENHTKLDRLCARIHAVEIPEPMAGIESITEYDRRRGIKAQLLDLVVQTTVETAAAARILAAMTTNAGAIAGSKSIGPTAHLPVWEAEAMRLERAILTADVVGVRKHLPKFVQIFQHEPLLVCPPADGGEPAQALRAQIAQQMMESLLARLPRIGLLRETYQLARLSRQMERNHIPDGRRVSSFDVLFRTALMGTVDAVLNSARSWDDNANEDGPLASALKLISESYQQLWYEHSQTLRLSSLESVMEGREWSALATFVQTYGSDLFTVRFLTLSNIRGILAQEPSEWLDREAEETEDLDPPRLIRDWQAGNIDKTRTAKNFEVVLSTLVEHYEEYRDYNTTTTQSDYGENLYIFLDILRLKVTYDRHAWRIKPLILAHDSLCKHGYDRLAAKWRDFVGERMNELANDLLTELGRREAEHGIQLRTVRDRLEERFVQPLRVDQAGARVLRAAAAVRDGQPEDNPAFEGLLAAIQPLAESPVGVGLEVPLWVRRLEDELRTVKLLDPDDEDEPPSATHGIEEYPLPTQQNLLLEDFRLQIDDWDIPLLEGME